MLGNLTSLSLFLNFITFQGLSRTILFIINDILRNYNHSQKRFGAATQITPMKRVKHTILPPPPPPPERRKNPGFSPPPPLLQQCFVWQLVPGTNMWQPVRSMATKWRRGQWPQEEGDEGVGSGKLHIGFYVLSQYFCLCTHLQKFAVIWLHLWPERPTFAAIIHAQNNRRRPCNG